MSLAHVAADEKCIALDERPGVGKLRKRAVRSSQARRRPAYGKARPQRRMGITPGANFARGCRNLDACGQNQVSS